MGRDVVTDLVERRAAHVRHGRLEAHAKGKDRAFEYIATSLRNDAAHLYRWFTRERYEEAQAKADQKRVHKATLTTGVSRICGAHR